MDGSNYANANELDTFEPIGIAAGRIVSNLVKFRKDTEVLNGTVVVSNGCLQGRTKCSDMNVTTVNYEPRNVSATPSLVDTLEPTPRSNMALVGIVLLAGRLSKISKSVVVTTSIDMVDQIGGPASGAIKPSQARCLVEESINANATVSLRGMDAPSQLTDAIEPDILSFPRKETCLPIIIENRTQPFDGELPGACFVRHLSKPHSSESAVENDQQDNDGAKSEKAEDQRSRVERRVGDLPAFDRQFKRI